jgi:uncharacterized membrane protein
MSHSCSARRAGTLLLPLAALFGACDTPTGGSAITAVEVNANTATMQPGASYHFDARAMDATGAEQSTSFVWTSSDATLATVNSTGLVTAHAPGLVRITATAASGGIEGSAELWVTRVGGVLLLPPIMPGGLTARLAVGRTMPVRISPWPAPGENIEGAEVTLTSSNPGVVAANADHSVTAVSVGTAVLTATVEGVSATMEVVVERGYTYQEVDGHIEGLNDSGWAVGRRGTRGVLWRDGENIDLGLEGVVRTAIGNGGDVVGAYTPAGPSPSRPFRWRDGVAVELTTGDHADGVATAVNAHGIVVGYSWDGTRYHSRAWDADGNPIALPAEPESGRALGVNDAGDIVGTSNNQAYLIRNGVRTVLPGISATGIRNDGLVTGQFVTDVNGIAAATFQSGSRSTLTDPGRHGTARPSDLNSHGQVVGTSHAALGHYSTGWVWHGGDARPLGLLLPDDRWSVTEATAINDAGTIIAIGVRGSANNWERRSLILTPKP